MKALILLATLKKEGQSNTQVLSEFFTPHLQKHDVEIETVKLVDWNIHPGTCSDMGNGDQWPDILQKILDADIMIWATPIWWGGHSSQMQQVIERLDELHDEILAGKKSRLEDKVGGIIVTGDSDGEQHIIGNIANFFNAVGIVLPPFATLTVQSQQQAKDKNPSREELIELYKKEYAKAAETMAAQLVKFAK